MTREVEPAKPKLKHLKLIKRMLEEDLGYTRSGSINASDLGQFFNRKTKGRDGVTVPEGYRDNHQWWEMNIAPKCHDTCHKLWAWGWVNRVEKPESAAWYNTYYSPTRSALQYWKAEGEALYDKLMSEEAEKRAKVERLCIIGKKTERLRDGSDRKAEMLVRVIRETEKRLYIEIVDSVSQYGSYDIVEGNRDKMYITKDQVWKDDVTEAYYRRVVDVEDGIVAEKTALRSERDDAIAAIREQYGSRTKQRDAEYDDRLRELDAPT